MATLTGHCVDTGISSFVAALKLVAEDVARDWTDANQRHALAWHGTSEDIVQFMVDFARGLPEQCIRGSIHPQYTPARPRLFGFWSF